MRTDAAVKEAMMQQYFCTHCGCALGLHTDEGCQCLDEAYHKPDPEDEHVCYCPRDLELFWENEHMSTDQPTPNPNGSQAHPQGPLNA
jgi:hypothetical protein